MGGEAVSDKKPGEGRVRGRQKGEEPLKTLQPGRSSQAWARLQDAPVQARSGEFRLQNPA